ncbi:MAG: polysaccharide biosynthesis C-terminal domain-containing protein, partial [Myxococcales bacterium]|nr:polysaccharide biosynthesis C-terminal domain-containing protein [Myxococcales bacterium]
PLLLLDYGLVGLAAGHAVGQVVANLGAYSMVRRRLPEVRISPRYVSRDGMRKVLSVGGRFQLLWAVNTIVLQGVKILISKLVGVEWVGIYELADKLISLGKTASEAVVAPLMPAFASLQAGGDKLRERLLFLKGSKADALMGGSSFTFLALFAPSILLLWTGEAVPQSAWTLRVLAVGEASLLLTSVVSSSLRAQGRVRLEFTWAMITTGIMVALVVPLAPLLGYEGVVYSRLVAQLLGTIWYLRAYFKVAGLRWGEYLRGTRIPRLAGLLAVLGGLLLLAHQLLPRLLPPGLSPRWAAAVELTLWGTLYLGLLGTAVWRTYLEPDDRLQIATLARAIWDKVRGRGPAPPQVVVVAMAGLDLALPLTEAAAALGRAEAMLPGAAGEYIGSGAALRLVVVQLGPDSDPREQYVWLQDNRPDLLPRLVFAVGRDDPFYAEVAAHRYASLPDGETLRVDWGDPHGGADEPPEGPKPR